MPVSAARHDVNLRLDNVNFSERLAKEAQEGQARKEKSDADMEARRVASNKRRIEARKAVDVRTDFEKLQDQIDAIVDDDIIILKNPENRKLKRGVRDLLIGNSSQKNLKYMGLSQLFDRSKMNSQVYQQLRVGKE